MTIAMPDPVARATVHMRQDRRQFLLVELGTEAAGELTWGEHDLITTTQAEAYAAAKVREALEAALAEAKRVSDKYGYGYYGSEVDAVDEAAARIRALLPPTE